MIRLHRLSKSYATKVGAKQLMRDVSLTFPAGRSVALLGRNGAGKSTLLRMIAGITEPDRGWIEHSGTVSWPIGFAGSFHPELTGAQNARFLARVYGVDTEMLLSYAQDFAELDDFFNMPFRTYSAGMRSRLAFGVSMAVPFDTYLIDEVTSVGDARFREKCTAVLKDRLTVASAIIVSHSVPIVKDLCDSGVVLSNGEVHAYDNIDDALRHHVSLLKTD